MNNYPYEILTRNDGMMAISVNFGNIIASPNIGYFIGDNFHIRSTFPSKKLSNISIKDEIILNNIPSSLKLYIKKNRKISILEFSKTSLVRENIINIPK